MAINRRNMRILLILILSIFSFMFCFKYSNLEKAFADSPYTPKVSVESKTVHRGQTFSVDVDLSDNEGLISLFLSIDYNDKVMTLTNVIQGDALATLTMTTTNVETEQGYSIKPFNILWDGKDIDKTNGTIVKLIFDTYIDADIGEYPITLTYDKQNTNIAYQTPIDIEISNGIINLITGEFNAVYRDYDEKVLFAKDYNADDVPKYPGDEQYPLPSRAEDAEYSYEFIGWKGVPSDDLNTLIFEANYKLTPQKYTIFYYIDGYQKGSLINRPDGIIDENDFFSVEELDFGTYIETPNVPLKQYYQFYGWYEDENFTKPSMNVTMPSHDIRLYGYYHFDVREDNIPIISLEDVSISSNLEEVVVSASIIKNTGFNGLVLILNYDSEALVFDHFERGKTLYEMNFDTTNSENIGDENFKFYYEYTENNYETGEFLKLYFRIKPNVEDKTYKVWFDYDFYNATYIVKHPSGEKEIKCTMVEFYEGEVPVGLIYQWNKDLSSERGVDISSDEGKPINVYLEVELVTNSFEVNDEVLEEVGDNMFVSSAYDIRLMQNKKEIQPNTNLTIGIKLTEKELKSNIEFYYLDENNELIKHDFKIENDELVFTTNRLSNCVIFSDYSGNSGNNQEVIFGSGSQAMYLIGMPILLALATMLYALRLRQKLTRIKKEAHND